MKSEQEVELVATRLGQCTISTVALNWVTMHTSHIIACAMAPARAQETGAELHSALDQAMHDGTPNPMESEGPEQICTVTIHGSTLLALVGSIVKMDNLYRNPHVAMIAPDLGFDLDAGLRSSLASFRTYLIDREVDAEDVLPELF